MSICKLQHLDVMITDWILKLAEFIKKICDILLFSEMNTIFGH